MNRIHHAVAIALAAFLIAPPAVAEKLTVGSELPAFELKNEKGKKVAFGPDVRRIYATASRDADGFVEKALKKNGQEKLDAQGAIVLADISAAPFFIKGFIRDSLEERRYSTWVDDEGDVSERFPHKDDQVTIVDLDRRRVTAIRYAKDIKELRAELAPEAPPPEKAPATPPPAPDAAATGGDKQKEEADGDL